jgi:predicted O-methyltransferase YrrM
MNRYAELLKYIRRIQPNTIIEVGTWNGERAMAMAKEALKHRPFVSYLGYSLFEEATPETDAEEFNVKTNYSLAEVKATLNEFAERTPGFRFQLVRGNTRETLAKNPQIADFAFIDGGHSVETIDSDYEALKGCGFIVLDDYYTDYKNVIDISKVGCNMLIDRLMREHKRVSIVPPRDKVRGGGFVQLAVVDNQ